MHPIETRYHNDAFLIFSEMLVNFRNAHVPIKKVCISSLLYFDTVKIRNSPSLKTYRFRFARLQWCTMLAIPLHKDIVGENKVSNESKLATLK